MRYIASARPSNRIENFGHMAGNARRHAEGRAVPAKSENAFDGCLIHPAGRTRVPRPPAAAEMHRVRVDIGGDGVRLRLVLLESFGASACG